MHGVVFEFRGELSMCTWLDRWFRIAGLGRRARLNPHPNILWLLVLSSSIFLLFCCCHTQCNASCLLRLHLKATRPDESIVGLFTLHSTPDPSLGPVKRTTVSLKSEFLLTTSGISMRWSCKRKRYAASREV